MKKFMIATLIGLFIPNPSIPQDNPPPAAVADRIRSVIVYPNMALVTRSVRLALEPGDSKIRLSPLPPTFPPRPRSAPWMD